MMKKVILGLLAPLLLLIWHPGLSADGENLFNMKCGKCHTQEGSAPVFAPVKYASSQWDRFFARDKHKRKKDISDIVSKQEIELIKEYLVSHAADSDRPIAAGLR
ncbi:cytochrome c [Desulfobacterales bacterium HSG17]|nr:cytochrome c [Desulfobacterales bacterium HSG17]